MKKLLAAALFALVFTAPANAEVRYFVDDASNILKTLVTDDNLTAPTGETAVSKSTIETACGCEIYLSGTWDGTTYTPPTGIVTAIDETTDAGSVQVAAHKMMDVLEEGLAFIRDNQHVWPDAARAIAVDGIHWQIVNSARIALNATRTAARRQKFCEESASWPLNTNGNVVDYVDAIAAQGTPTTPTKDWSWVTPEADPYTRVAVGTAHNQFGSATNVENAPSSEKLIGRDWINDIP